MRRITLLFVLAFPGFAIPQEAKDKPTIVFEMGAHIESITAGLFTADARQLITVSTDKTIRFWSLETGEQLRVLRPPFGPGKEGELYAAALSPDGKTLAVAGYGLGEGDKRHSPIYLIDTEQGIIRRTLEGHKYSVLGLAFSPDGLRLASAGFAGPNKGSGIVRVQRLDKPGDVVELKHKGQGGVDGVYSVCFSPDGKRVVGRIRGGFRLWDLTTGAAVGEKLEDHGVSCTSLVWSPDGKTIATAHGKDGIRLWNPDATLRSAFKQYDANGLAFQGGSSRLLFRAQGETRALDLATGKDQVLLKHGVHAGPPEVIPVSRDGSLAAYSFAQIGGSQGIRVWKLSAEPSLLLEKKLFNLGYIGSTYNSTGWSADGKSVGVDYDQRLGTRFSFSPADMRIGPSLKADNFRGGPVQRQGELTFGAFIALGRETTIQKGKTPIARLKLPTPGTTDMRTFFGQDRVVIAADDGSLFSFNKTSGELLHRCRAHQGFVHQLSPSPDGRYVLSSSRLDKTLSIWNPDQDKLLLSLKFLPLGKKTNLHNSPAHLAQEWVAWTPEGYYAASSGGEALINWCVSNGPDQIGTVYPAAKFRPSLYRPDVIARLLEFGSVDKALEAADKARGQKTEKHDIAEVLPPRVRLVAPGSSQRVTKPDLEIKAAAESVGTHPVTALQLLLDGRPYQGEAGIVAFQAPRPGKVEASWKIQLPPGPHTLSILARCSVSSATSEEVAVTYEPATTVDPKSQLPGLYVLAVGINTYPGDWKLNCAANDALDIERIFKAKANPVFREVQTKLLTDKEATRQGVLDGLAWLKKQMKPQDIAVIFYAGHGARDAKGRFYLLPCDVNFAAVEKTGVSGDDVKKRLAELPGRVLVLLDACHSGAIGGKGGLTDELTRELSDDDCGVVVMCAAMGREEAGEERKLRHGYFALAVIEGLSGKADVSKRDGRVYLHHLEQYVIDRVQELSNDEQHPVVGKPTTVRSFALAKP